MFLICFMYKSNIFCFRIITRWPTLKNTPSFDICNHTNSFIKSVIFGAIINRLDLFKYPLWSRSPYFFYGMHSYHAQKRSSNFFTRLCGISAQFSRVFKCFCFIFKIVLTEFFLDRNDCNHTFWGYNHIISKSLENWIVATIVHNNVQLRRMSILIFFRALLLIPV